jgi:hypothetical protein
MYCDQLPVQQAVGDVPNIMQEPAAARPKPPPGRRHVAPAQRQQQPGVVSITEELAHAPPANRPSRSRGFVLNPMCACSSFSAQTSSLMNRCCLWVSGIV